MRDDRCIFENFSRLRAISAGVERAIFQISLTNREISIGEKIRSFLIKSCDPHIYIYIYIDIIIQDKRESIVRPCRYKNFTIIQIKFSAIDIIM